MSWLKVLQIFIWIAVRGHGAVSMSSFSRSIIGCLWNEKRKDRSTETSIAFGMIALVAAILIVYFDTVHKLKLLDARIENIEMSGPQTK
jgi:hypothetical protein